MFFVKSKRPNGGKTGFRRFFLTLISSLLLISTLLSQNAGLAYGQAQPGPVTLTGTLSTVWGDPLPGSGLQPKTIYTLVEDNGRSYQLSFPPKFNQTSVKLLDLNRKRVKLVGSPSAGLAQIANAGQFTVQSIQLDTSKTSPAPRVVGTQPYVSIMCKFQDIADEPRDQAWFNTQLSNTKPGFNHYFQEMSFNRLNLNGSTALGWYTLPKPRIQYFNPDNSANLDLLAQDCTASVGSNFDFTPFYGIDMMFNGQLDGSAWGGSTTLTLNNVTKNWPATWMPYYTNDRFGWLEHGILAHEMGHAFGAPHTADSLGYQYGNSWDVVSNPQAGCYPSNSYPTPIPGSVDPQYGCLGQHISGVLKQVMGFYDPAKVYTYTNGSGPQTIKIERQALPTGVAGSYLLALVNSPTNPNVQYSIEARFRTPNSYDTKLRGDGVIMYRNDPNNPTQDKTWLLAPPGATNDAERCNGNVCGVGAAQAIWPVGSTMTNNTDGVVIRVDGFDSIGTAIITINPSNLPTLIVTQPTDDGSGTVAESLSKALKDAAVGQSITFNLTGGGTTVLVSGQLPPPTNSGVTLDGGSCVGGVPGITIQATGNAATDPNVNGLVLSKSLTVKNLKVSAFGGQQLFSLVIGGSGNNKLGPCVKASKL